MTTLSVENFGPSNIKKQTLVNQQIQAGATSMVSVDIQDISVSDYAIFGQLGQPGSEIVQILTVTPSTNTITFGATLFAHDIGEPITVLVGNQIKIYSAANVNGYRPADTGFSVLTTLNVDPNAKTTSYTDTNGSNAVWYKFIYYNQTTTAQSNLADSTAQRGGGYGHYASIADIRDEAGFSGNVNISDGKIESARTTAEAEINGTLLNVYTLPFPVPIPPQIVETTKLIAAGILLKQEYGPFSTGSKKQAQEKIDEGRAMLLSLKTRDETLYDAAGNSLLLQLTVSSWPNDSTTDTTGTLGTDDLVDNNMDSGPAFARSMRF